MNVTIRQFFTPKRFSYDTIIARLSNFIELPDNDNEDLQKDKKALIHKIAEELYYNNFLSIEDAENE